MNRVTTLLKSEIGQTLRQNRPIIILVTVLTALLLTATGVIGAGLASYAQQQTTRGAITLINVTAGQSAQSAELTDKTVKKFEAVDGVAAVYPTVTVALETEFTPAGAAPKEESTQGEEAPASVWGRPVIPGQDPAIIAPEELKKAAAQNRLAQSLKPGEIILPKPLAGQEGKEESLIGKTLAFSYIVTLGQQQGIAKTIDLKVVGIADNSVPDRDGPSPAYLSLAQLDKIAPSALDRNYSEIWVKAKGADDVEQIQKALGAMGYRVTSLKAAFSELGGIFALLGNAVKAFTVILILTSLALGAATGSIWVRRRVRDIGVLKSVGWSRKMIVSVICWELYIIGFVAAATGILTAIVGSLAATTAVAKADINLLPVLAWQIPPLQTLLLAIALIPLFVVAGGIPRALKASRIDPDDALRGA